jgi:hypothetical protein
MPGYCPWNSEAYNYKNQVHNPDCVIGGEPLCNLRYIGRCGHKAFGRVYQNICQWLETTQLMPMLLNWIQPLGVMWEKHNSRKCNANWSPRMSDLERAMGDTYIDGDQLIWIDNDDNRFIDDGEARDTAQCSISAGLVDCHLINFQNANDEYDLYFIMRDLTEEIGKKCNKEWNKQTRAIINRLEDTMTCPNN